MSKIKGLNEIAQSIADVTLELMYDSVDWQLEDFEQDGDEYNAIHAETLQRAIEIMYHETRKM
jgi:thiamine biosynthesis protein ThiC